MMTYIFGIEYIMHNRWQVLTNLFKFLGDIEM